MRYVPVQDNEAEEAEEESETARMFREAAEALKEKRDEEAMSVEERISKCVPDLHGLTFCRQPSLQCMLYDAACL